MAFIKNLISDISQAVLFDELRYQNWQQDTEKKIQQLQSHLLSLTGRSERTTHFHDHLKKVQSVVTELNPDLAKENFAGDSRNCQQIHQTRICLLNLWAKFLLLLDKLDDTRTVTLFLDSIHKIMARSEFDTVHLCWDEARLPQCRSEYIQSFKRYRQLLAATHEYIASKLAESRPVSALSSVIFGLV